MEVKTILDYYQKLFELYPTLPESDIKRIVLYGWKNFYLYSSYGTDILINRKGLWFYCGQLMNDSLKYFEYYKKKLSSKIRIFHARNHIPWDGYYYFALTKNLYDDYLNLKNKRGRPRKNFTFSKIILYQIYDDCNISLSNRVAIFRIPLKLKLGITIYKESLVTDKAELILVREPLKFNDILLTNYFLK